MPPNQAQLASFTGLRAFGIAGGSRAMSPEQMARELPPAFKALKASGALFIHYKTCSTFVLVDVLKLEAERSGKVGAEIAEKLRSLKWR